VCNGSGSFGGDSYAGGVIYMACTNGTMALAYDAAARSFTPLWQGPSDAFGPPILSAGLVWTLATGGFSGGGTKLYGLDPGSGKPRYTLTLPSPVTDHFGSPSAAGGRVYVATGSTITAYQTAVLTALESPSPVPLAPAGAKPLATGRAVLVLLVTHLRAGRHRRVHGHARTVRIPIGHVTFAGRRGTFTVALRLNRTGRGLLRRHHHRLRVSVVLALSGGATHSAGAVLRG